MPRCLVTVQDVFAIRGRGIVIAPLLAETEARREKFPVELRRPDGSSVRALALAQISFINPPPPKRQADLILLDVTKEEVPIGTQVWTLD